MTIHVATMRTFSAGAASVTAARSTAALRRAAALLITTVLLITTALVSGCGAPPPKHEITSEDGVEIAYSSAGAGEPAMVFVHGWTLDRSYWEDQMRYFSDERHTVAIDLAGHGESGSEREDWTMAAFGADVAAVVEGLGLRRVILVGHSMGGSVVLEASQLLGDRVAGIVLVDAFHDPDRPMPDEEREAILASYREDFQTNVSEMAAQYLFAPETDSVLAGTIVIEMSTFDPEIGLKTIEHLFRSDYREMLRHIRPPMVAINSDLYSTNEEAMTRYGVAVRTMSGVGHFPMVEKPEEFNAILADVVRNWR